MLQATRRIGDLDVVARLNAADICQQLRPADSEQAVADAEFGLLLAGEQPAPVAHVDDGILGRALGWPSNSR